MFLGDIEKHLKLSLNEALIKYLPKKEGEGERLVEAVIAVVIQTMVNQGNMVKGDRLGSIQVILLEPNANISHVQRKLIDCSLQIASYVNMKKKISNRLLMVQRSTLNSDKL